MSGISPTRKKSPSTDRSRQKFSEKPTLLEALLTDIKPIFSQIYNLVQDYELYVSSTKEKHRDLNDTFPANCLQALVTIKNNLGECFKEKSVPEISNFLDNDVAPMFMTMEGALKEIQREENGFYDFLEKLDEGMHELTIFPRKLLVLIRVNYATEAAAKKKKSRYSEETLNELSLQSQKMEQFKRIELRDKFSSADPPKPTRSPRNVPSIHLQTTIPQEG